MLKDKRKNRNTKQQRKDCGLLAELQWENRERDCSSFYIGRFCCPSIPSILCLKRELAPGIKQRTKISNGLLKAKAHHHLSTMPKNPKFCSQCWQPTVASNTVPWGQKYHFLLALWLAETNLLLTCLVT